MPDYKQRPGWERSSSGAIWDLFGEWEFRAGKGRFDIDAFAEDGVELFTPTVARPYVTGGETLFDQFGQEWPSQLPDAAWAQKYAQKFMRDLARNVAADLEAAGVKVGGEDLDLIFSKSRAARGGVTSVTTAISAGELDAAKFIEKMVGSKLLVRWNTERDRKVCRLCKRLDGQLKARWSYRFPSGPPAHPYCRCYLEFS